MTTSPDDFRLTPEAVKVLAHPLRSRLLGTLRRGGPATATSLATTLSTNSGATSYHLRKLESVGLVTDTGEGTGKQRLWRAATSSHSWAPSELSADEDAATALSWLQRDYLRLFSTEFGHWLDVAEAWPSEWQDAAGLGDTWLSLNAVQLVALRADLDQLFERYETAGGGPGAVRVAVWQAAFPLEMDDIPGADNDAGTDDDPDSKDGPDTGTDAEDQP
ncbi:ArsR family transcriptional regulator [Promicromonospora sp. AC04]|uniref:ArsR/SmtB family transcription factor n=1 Tax=Promicromonospora sp. AC04 TaxID=2135723 RepID=UPI000D3CEA45|nr:helix-turn-helix domain-containing protein [Promicromonospora sp. AC04]PUB29077.1 ArsR family transcriptional regulator [Promicromonospora sp. AC04]